MNGPDQLTDERHFLPGEDLSAAASRSHLSDVMDAIDLILTKSGQLQGLLAFMTHLAVDEEVIPAHRMAVCQIAVGLTEDILLAATSALQTSG